MIFVAILSLPFLVLMARRPVLRRLAVRNASRRPRETLLVIAGSLLGTAIMTGAFVVGDSFTASIRASAYEQLGPIDEVVSMGGLDSAGPLAETLDGLTDDDRVDGMLPAARSAAAVATISEPRLAAPKAQLLEVDFAEAREFGGDADATGISGETPEPGRAAIVDDLAARLDVGEGDTIQVFAFGGSQDLVVDRVLPQTGVAGFWDGVEAASYNAFVAPGTIAELAASGDPATLALPPESLVFVSNRGGVEGGAELSDEVAAEIEQRLGDLPANVAKRKQAVLDSAEANGEQLTQLYSSLGMFAVIAGILLLVNIFVMLAEERKSELGMLRALGLRRLPLVGAFATEGWAYALVSSLVGTVVGLGLGRVMMSAAGRIFSSGPEEFRMSLRWDFEWSSVQQGLAVGFTIALVTVLLTSIRISRFNIIQAIRDINEPPRPRPRRRSAYLGVALTAVGIALTLVGASSGAILALMAGPAIALAGVGPILARRFPTERVTNVVASLVLAWGVVSVPVAIMADANPDVVMFVVQGLMLVGAAVVLVSRNQDAIGHAVAHLWPRSLQVRLGLAYPLARRFRTAMTLGMFALVVFILVFTSVISNMFNDQLDTFTDDVSGGYDTIVTSNAANPIPVDDLAAEPGVLAIAPLAQVRASITEDGADEPTEWAMSAFGEEFVDHGPPVLEERGSYPTDEAAYRAVLADPSLAIVDDFFLSGGAGPPSEVFDIGDTFLLEDRSSGTSREMTVAALGPNDWVFNGGLMGETAAREIFGDRAVANRAYVDSEDPDEFAPSVAGRFLANGGEGKTIRATVEEVLSQQQQFFLLMRGFLALGLVVGIAGIGVIMVRAVRERRRQVGVLRALGLQARAVQSAFEIESVFIAVESVVLGTVLALVTAFSMTLTDTFGESLPFSVPWIAVGVLSVGTLVGAVLATLMPARSAARIRPAVALRIAD